MADRVPSPEPQHGGRMTAQSAVLLPRVIGPQDPRPWRLPADDADAAARRAAVWARVRNLLVIRLDNLGDVLMSTPALRAIKDTQPQARITLLASAAGAAATEVVPLVDEVIRFDAPWVRQPAEAAADAAGAPALGSSERALIAALMKRRFDAAIIFTVHSQSALPAALLCLLAGIPLRLAHCRENPYGLLSDWVREPEPHTIQRHEVERQLALVERVGYRTRDDRLRFDVPATARAAVLRRLLRAGVDPSRPYVVVHPGASAPSRRWPAVDFGRAADLLGYDHQIVLVGGPAEAPLVEQMLAAMRAPAAVLAEELSLAELGALIQGAAVLLANNSAPAHIAAAVGTPVVVLYALTNPQHTPWRVPARVLYRDVPCRNCMKSECPLGHHECLLGVRPAQVATAARELMAHRPRSAPVLSPADHGSEPVAAAAAEAQMQAQGRAALQPGQAARGAACAGAPQ